MVSSYQGPGRAELQGSSPVPVGRSGNRGRCPITETGQQGRACRRKGSGRLPRVVLARHLAASFHSGEDGTAGRMALCGVRGEVWTGQGESCNLVWGFRKVVWSGSVTPRALRV